ncbi:MAG: TIM-barrel domain-containing protein [Kiritimatiellia bacterium]
MKQYLHPDALYDEHYVETSIPVTGFQSPTDETAKPEYLERGVQFSAGGFLYRLEAWSAGIYRLQIVPEQQPPPTSTTEALGLIQVPGAPSDFTLEETNFGLRLGDDALAVDVNPATGAITLSGPDGETLLSSRNGGFRFQPDSEETYPAYFAEFDAQDESFFGFGGRIMPPRRNGSSLDVFSVKTGVKSGDYGGFPMPYFISTRGYGVFLNNPWPHVYFDMGRETESGWSMYAPGGPCDLFFIAGPEFSDVITRFTSIVGRATEPPRWILGFWCSSLGFASAEQAVKDAKRLREEGYPCDVFVFDGPWRSGNQFIQSYAEGHDYPAADVNWHSDFGDGPAMVRALEHLHIKTGLHVNSRVFSPDTAEKGIANGMLRRHGEEVVPRVGLPEAEEAYAALLEPRIREGVALWWTDHADRVSGEVLPGLPSRNLFGPLWNRLIHRAMPPGDSVFPMSLSRGGGIGSQRYALPWPGDTRCGVDALMDDVWFMINAGLSGFPLTSTDLGGFAVRKDPVRDYAGREERDAEMFQEENLARRLCQALLYVPLPRIHNNWETTAKFPWNCTPDIQALYKQALTERYALTPYWFHYALLAAETGQPILRPLVYSHRNDPHSTVCEDQFYVGDWLMMAPGYREGEEKRNVYLPGGEWMDFWTGQIYGGGQTIEIDVPILSLRGLGIFIRRGAIIPRQPFRLSLDNHLPGALSFDVYPDGDTNMDLREGRGFSSRLSCTCDSDGYRIELENGTNLEREYTVRLHGFDRELEWAEASGRAEIVVAVKPGKSARLKAVYATIGHTR